MGLAYGELREMFVALGGSLIHQKLKEPRGGTWIATLGGCELRVLPEQVKQYPLLDACYQLKGGHVYETWDDCVKHAIDPKGIAELFAQLSRRKKVAVENVVEKAEEKGLDEAV
jgi:hypothetical protein